MKFSSAVLAVAGATLAAAQTLPTCAVTCFATAIGKTSCSLTDYACQCSASNSAIITTNVTPCVISACSTSDQAQVAAVADQICAAALGSSSVAANQQVSTSVVTVTSTSLRTISTSSTPLATVTSTATTTVRPASTATVTSVATVTTSTSRAGAAGARATAAVALGAVMGAVGLVL